MANVRQLSGRPPGPRYAYPRVTARLRPDLAKALREAAVEEAREQWSILEEALDLWLARRAGDAPEVKLPRLQRK